VTDIKFTDLLNELTYMFIEQFKNLTAEKRIPEQKRIHIFVTLMLNDQETGFAGF
jgi:hypothetical protein